MWGSLKAESLLLTDENRGPADREVPAASHGVNLVFVSTRSVI